MAITCKLRFIYFNVILQSLQYSRNELCTIYVKFRSSGGARRIKNSKYYIYAYTLNRETNTQRVINYLGKPSITDCIVPI